jgi:hypothetical protein
MRRVIHLAALILPLLASSLTAVAAEPTAWIDFKKNGKQDIY